MILQDKISDEIKQKLAEKKWYRHGIYRSIFMWAAELLPSLGEEYFRKEGINKGLNDVVQMDKEFFITYKEFEEFCEIYTVKLNEGTDYLNKYIIDYNKDMDFALSKSKQLGDVVVTDLNNKDLAERFVNHFDVIRPLHHWLWSMEFLNESFDKKIRAEVARVYPDWSTLEIDNFLTDVSYTSKRQFFQQERDDMAKLEDFSEENIRPLFEKYRWQNMCFIDGQPFSFDEYLVRVQEMFENKTELISGLEQNKLDVINAHKIIQSVKDQTLKDYLILMQELAFLKTYRIDVYTLWFYYVHNLRNEIIKRLNLSLDEFLHHSIKEIVESLRGNITPRDVIADRKDWCLVKVDNKIEYFKGSAVIKLIRNIIWDDGKRVQVIKGTVAFRGKVTGKVRLSYSNTDINQVMPGEILVCNLTNPDYNPVFKKVVGIITDEGGVLCHSAIMAREFKIPCVINTKIATQVLKDGDMVEVDAENGVVTVIDKKDILKNFPSNLILANQDIDISWINLEVIWDGMLKGDIKKQLGIDFPKSVCEMKKGKTINLYVEANDLKNFIETSAAAILNDDKLLNLLESRTVEVTKNIRDYAFELVDKIETLSLDDLLEILPKIKKLQSESMIYGCVVAFADVFGEITDRTTKILNDRKNLKHPTNVYSSAISGLQKTLTEQAYEDIISSKLSDEELLKKYFWLDQGYTGRGLTIEKLYEIKKHKIDPGAKLKAEYIDELNLTAEEKRVFEISKSLILIKSLRSDSRQFLNVVTSRIVDKIAKELKLDVKLIETLYTEEMCSLLKGNKEILNNLEERYNHSLFIANGPSDYTIITNDAVDKFLKYRLVKNELEKTNEIRGQVASSGKVSGVAKLVFGPQHIGKVNEGDIMVSTATSPQLLPAMKKAAAFVTDVGGITSHAAIVSRELKKPCVVGTKIATQVLKDGDMVEVDAENGIIKVLAAK